MVSQASAAAFCGTLPTGTDGTRYAKLAKITAQADIPLLVDAWRDVDDIFSSGARIILKINREELAALTQQESVQAGLTYLKSRWGITQAAITDGPGQAYAFDGEKIMRYTLPRLEKVVNPIGCGDTASAVLLSGLVTGSDLFSAFSNALAAASANCLSSLCGSFALADVQKIAVDIKKEMF
jgi:fructose-1-phosphate kinase PfkB-like protein